nr:tRNA modification GTPase MnmE [uncultured Prevotella sp.]
MSTICAPATSTGGAIAIIRISGKDTQNILNKVFCKDLTSSPSHTAHFGQVMDKTTEEVIDDVLVTIFRAPHSYTGEDCAEISCHASRYIVQQICSLLIKEGCAPAAPGEFTKRAFLNGKMDLSQAEAVADLIASENRASHDIALNQLKGHFSNELAELRKQLLKLTSLLELELDFSDHEELELADRTELKALANTIDKRIQQLAHSFETGQAIKNGIPVAIVGKTNVGKSTLLNRLIHEDKAIVSNIHGTTRDVIEDTTVINGITFRFIDTAGIRNTTDEVERLGIERTYKKLQEARIILWVIDNTPSESDLKSIKNVSAGKRIIIVCNKIDKTNITLSPSIFTPNQVQKAEQYNTTIIPIIRISAKQGTNISNLETAIYTAADIPNIQGGDVIITNSRHYNALCQAHSNLQRVKEAFATDLSGDLIAEDLRSVLSDLAEITGGRISSQETLNSIFSEFCIGK